MERLKLVGTSRKEFGKGPSRRLRKAGLVPAIVYGPHMDASISIAVAPMDMKRVLAAGDNVLVDLKIRDGEAVQSKLVMVKTCDFHPATVLLRHVDLYEVSLEEAIRVDVPIVLTGQAQGVTEGGMLTQLLRTLEVSCLPEQIPHEIELDCTTLRIGGILYVRDLKLPPEVQVITEPATAVVTIMEAVEEVEVAEVAAEEAPAEGETEESE